MKKLLSTKYSANALNVAMLLLRVVIGGLMLMHGYDKLMHFAEKSNVPVFNVFGIGSKVGLALVVFAEFFCSIFLILGLFTRLATVPLVIATAIMVFVTHKGEVTGDGEMAALYFVGYVVLLLIGPGKISVDGTMGK
jgi:putative oxidoreductase